MIIEKRMCLFSKVIAWSIVTKQNIVPSFFTPSFRVPYSTERALKHMLTEALQIQIQYVLNLKNLKKRCCTCRCCSDSSLYSCWLHTVNPAEEFIWNLNSACSVAVHSSIAEHSVYNLQKLWPFLKTWPSFVQMTFHCRGRSTHWVCLVLNVMPEVIRRHVLLLFKKRMEDFCLLFFFFFARFFSLPFTITIVSTKYLWIRSQVVPWSEEKMVHDGKHLFQEETFRFLIVMIFIYIFFILYFSDFHDCCIALIYFMWESL